MQDPNQDTEWNDQLRKHGILPAAKKNEIEIEEEKLAEMIEQTIQERMCPEKQYERMNLDQLNELEDDVDERILETYRRKRIEEMMMDSKKQRFGTVLEITAVDYINEINHAGEDISVVLHLYKIGIPLCSLINHLMAECARKYPHTKFVKSIGNLCIADYPDKHLPTLFIYRGGQMLNKLVGPESFPNLGGSATNVDPDLCGARFEHLLNRFGAIKSSATDKDGDSDQDDEDDGIRGRVDDYLIKSMKRQF